jgi:hypothetical protein
LKKRGKLKKPAAKLISFEKLVKLKLRRHPRERKKRERQRNLLQLVKVAKWKKLEGHP